MAVTQITMRCLRATYRVRGALLCGWVAIACWPLSALGGDELAPRPVVAVGGRSAPRVTTGRTVVLGIDALGPDMLIDALDRGDLPTFRKLYRDSASARVDVRPTVMPPLSPRVWATLATGRVPDTHGIHDWAYAENGIPRLYTSRDRRVPALWNIATAHGKRVGVVNWLTSYPAEAVNGFVISDRYNDHWARKEAGIAKAEIEHRRERSVYPASLIGRLGQVLDPVVDTIPNPKAYEAIDREVFRLAYAALREYPVDLLMIYTRSFDEQCHLTWHSHDPPSDKPTPKRDFVMEFLERFDWMLAELLMRLGPQDHLVVVSDHSFERGPGKGGRPQGIHYSDETAEALLLVRGPRVEAGRRLGTVDVLDVAPTVLELAGLPAARSMPGRIIGELFREPERVFVDPVESYELTWAGGPVDDSAETVDPALVERLRALGYMEEIPGAEDSSAR